VYPQYAVGLPKMVRKFITQNTFTADYMFAVDLYAHIRLGALGEIAGLLPINYGAYLKTPWNFIFALNAPKHPETVLQNAEGKLTRVIEDIRSRQDKRVHPSKRVGSATKYFSDGKFKVADNCTKCGICVGVCPARNIELRAELGGKPIFGSSCEICYACVNHCPAHAIYSNNAMMKRRRYRNPYVALDDIIAANSGMGSRL
jgi:Pyruvate/2-oxoacid:ferredoxin oxidoreductase delta subunit